MLGLIPADTDFSIFADPEHAGWPGLDIAFLLDAASYHTDRDTVDRIKTGTLQARGSGRLCMARAACFMQHSQLQSRRCPVHNCDHLLPLSSSAQIMLPN